WFYVSHGCLLHSGDVERVTLIINGGRNGLADRKVRYNRALAALS
ncbi:MAG: glycoside hydrolase family 19 protein, partial [Leclercia adecarboxylata]|nr:glycoside hydrolase family 19 protein [Leclercia adecarboxylata]